MNKLTPEEYRVIIDKGTEAPHIGEYVHNHTDGIYICRQCNTALYMSDSKFDSDCGWPSFDQSIPGRVAMTSDVDWHRTEITCRTCGGHLWHVFVGEQITEENTRHCVNSLSMKFVPSDQIDELWIELPDYDTVILGGGCFWCIEGALAHIPWVVQAISWYAWGRRPQPTYEQICTGVSGHHEVVKIWFDPSILSLEQLLWYFMAIHDPTSQDKQWWDAWVQYRSVIIAKDTDQEKLIQQFITKLDASDIYRLPVVTQILIDQKFRVAESYHQDFYTNNPNKPYCQMVVKPKIEKIMQLLWSKN